MSCLDIFNSSNHLKSVFVGHFFFFYVRTTLFLLIYWLYYSHFVAMFGPFFCNFNRFYFCLFNSSKLGGGQLTFLFFIFFLLKDLLLLNHEFL